MADHRLIDGKSVASEILASCKGYLQDNDVLCGLVSISIGDIPEVDIYIRNQARAAERVGLPFKQQVWDATISQDEAKGKIVEMNDDPGVLGIILQRPVPDHINVRSLQSAIHPLKDVEGMNPASIGNIVYSDVALAPCTAAASVELIKRTG
ncbi:MAG: bifunctional 5,10-methylenetetrahydrofolate dehydrogenase/5,10-methenyltetrahydrofolate cyclohydrolase, partial [Silicimonas sp.]|nr:bifunctional 5,10-methylenetetrahydrofolate dehydrogenase/5,10-methenyltetrahydrofolate cyclohydrolase [Silicimonas sp.]